MLAQQRVLALMYCGVVLRSDQPERPASERKLHHSTETTLSSQSLECRGPRRSHSVSVPLVRRDVDDERRLQPLQLAVHDNVHANIDIVMETTAAVDTRVRDEDDDKVSHDGAGEC